jgi:hypothetical protein
MGMTALRDFRNLLPVWGLEDCMDLSFYLLATTLPTPAIPVNSTQAK